MDNKTIKSRPKEFFLHLLAIVTLYISAASFITLLFQFANYFFPDVAEIQYGYNSWIGPMRFAVASLIIVFPVFAVVSAYLEKLYKSEPDLRDLRVRRWLLNFTLFVAALVIIGDFTAIIYQFISGEIAIRFIVKALSILFTSLLIFGYYFIDLRHEPEKTGFFTRANKMMIAYIALGAVTLSVVGSFFVMGSPFEARERNIDNIRISHLQSIQNEIAHIFYPAKGRLPETLDELKDDISGFSAQRDPETKEPYIYRVTGELSFDLCANFSTASTSTLSGREPYPITIDNNWNHTAGEYCFHRTIDPDRYNPPFKPVF